MVQTVIISNKIHFFKNHPFKKQSYIIQLHAACTISEVFNTLQGSTYVCQIKMLTGKKTF